MAKAIKKKKTLKLKASTAVVNTNPKVVTTPDKDCLTVDGTPYSPISLDKFINSDNYVNMEDDKRGITVIIDGCGIGLLPDNADTTNVMIKDRIMQAEWFIDEIYPTLPRIPAYLYRYIQWIMFNEDSKLSYDQMKYPTDNDYIQALASKTLEQDDDEYQKIHNFIKYGKINTEATHLIGLLQLVGGTLKAAAKQNSGVRFFIELPETGFHPKRERILVTLLMKLKEEYGLKKDWTPTK